MSGAGAEAVPQGADGPVRLRAVALATGPARPPDWVRAVALSRTGAWAVSGGVDGMVRGWDLAHGTPGPVLAGHRGAVNGVAVSGDGRWAVSGGADGTVRVWDLRRGTPGPVRDRHLGGVYAVALSADGGRVVSGGGDGTVRVWDLTHAARGGGLSGRGRLGPVLHGHRGAVLSVAVSGDGRWAVSGGEDRTVRVWDLGAGAPGPVLAGHTRWVRAVAVSGAGQWAVSGGEDGTVRGWDLGAGGPGPVLVGHTGAVNGVAVSGDGRWVVSGGQDGTVRVWERAGGREVARTGGAPLILACAVDAAGQQVVVAAEHVVRVFSVAGLDARDGEQ